MTNSAEEHDHAYTSILDGNTTVVEVKQREDEDCDSGGEETTMGGYLVNVRHQDGDKCSQRSGVYNDLFLGRSSMGVGVGDDSRDAPSFIAVVTLIIVSERSLLENDIAHGGREWWKLKPGRGEERPYCFSLAPPSAFIAFF